ncbi:hypothetical protein HDU92_002425 [Lobulomyces angularis]|nr:hypothetical protein HDU92_002425 [Lobulomyces angularis]
MNESTEEVNSSSSSSTSSLPSKDAINSSDELSCSSLTPSNTTTKFNYSLERNLLTVYLTIIIIFSVFFLANISNFHNLQAEFAYTFYWITKIPIDSLGIIVTKIFKRKPKLLFAYFLSHCCSFLVGVILAAYSNSFWDDLNGYLPLEISILTLQIFVIIISSMLVVNEPSLNKYYHWLKFKKIIKKNCKKDIEINFNGVPVSAPFLMNQASKIFDKEYPGLEISPVFVINEPNFLYEELGVFKYYFPSGCIVKVPVYEKLTQVEEERLGTNGIKKKPVGILVLLGDCEVGCAKVTLKEIRLENFKEQVIWRWNKT